MFVLPRAARSFIDRVVFGALRRVFGILLRFTSSYSQRDTIMAYYAPVGLMLLLPAWYIMIALGYSLMYSALGVEGWKQAFILSGSSLLTLGFSSHEGLLVNSLIFSEATLGLVLVALLIAYLPTLYSAFSRREQAVTLLEVRAGSPPSAVEMVQRFYRIHGIERLNDYWPAWESWFSDLGESHSLLPALVFFRSPVSQNSWLVAAGTVMDAAAMALSSVDIPASVSAQLSIRAGYIALRRICDHYEIPYPTDPHFPNNPISLRRQEFDAAIETLKADGIPLKSDPDQAWIDFAGWRVNYDQLLLALCELTMTPPVRWKTGKSPGSENLNYPEEDRH